MDTGLTLSPLFEMLRTCEFDLAIPAPGRLYRGSGILEAVPLTALGSRVLVIGGERSLAVAELPLKRNLGRDPAVQVYWSTYGVDCSESELARLQALATAESVTGIVGVGGRQGPRHGQVGGPSLGDPGGDGAHLRRHLCRLERPVQHLL
jgi:hypothetical protein